MAKLSKPIAPRISATPTKIPKVPTISNGGSVTKIANKAKSPKK